MSRVFVFTNHKGGVGKSTSATNVALGIVGMLRRAGAPNCRVLLVDTDSQGHATLVTTGHNDYGADLHVLPASPMLEGAERELTRVAGAPYRLADPLAKIAAHYAAIVIDTRPSFSLMTEMGLLAATDAIVPVEPRYLETVGLMSVIGKISEIREGWRHPQLHISSILVTKLDSRIRGHNPLLLEGVRNVSLFSAAADKLGCGFGITETMTWLLPMATRSGLSSAEVYCTLDKASRRSCVAHKVMRASFGERLLRETTPREASVWGLTDWGWIRSITTFTWSVVL